MTDLGYADKTYVCGPDCKAVKESDEQTPWWEKPITYVLWALIGTLAAIGGLDVALRILLAILLG